MIRKIAMGLLIFLTVIAQCVLFQIFEIGSIKPNLLLIVTVSFGLMRGRMSGLWTGFFCGLAVDIFFPGQIGLQALIYMWIGYLCGYLYRIFYDDDIKMPLLLVCAADFAYGIFMYFTTFLIRGRIHFPYYLTRIIIPEMLYTIIITIFAYKLLYHFEQLLSKTDKRSVDSLV